MTSHLPRPLFLPPHLGSNRRMSMLTWLIPPSLVLAYFKQGAG